MFRTLLRTLPSISGNVKLNCNLDLDFTKNNKTIYTKVNKAFLTLADHDKNSYVHNVDLLSSRWDYDLKQFYSFYSNKFFSSQFKFNKSDINLIDKNNNIKQRDTDFEFGVSRISYLTYNNQFSFFAPIYIDNILDLPNQFEITIKYQWNNKEISKNIIVPLRPENYIGLYETDNQLYNYLYRYIKEVDSKIVTLNGNKIKYFGIDLLKGGMSEAEAPSTAFSLYNVFNPLQKVDSLITSGFSKLRLCSKQFIPLTFNFDLNTLFSNIEAGRLFLSNCKISGEYKYTDDINPERKNRTLSIYDFDINPDELYIDNLSINSTTLNIVNNTNYINNLLDSDLPGLHESKFYKYQFSNRIVPNYTRWRIQKTNLRNNSIFDSQNYIINFNSLFDLYDNYFGSTLTANLNQIYGCCLPLGINKYNETVLYPFSTANNDTDYIEVSNLMLPSTTYCLGNDNYPKQDDIESHRYKNTDYYTVITDNDYKYYYDNIKSGIYEHFNNIYLDPEYLSSYDEDNNRVIQKISEKSYIETYYNDIINEASFSATHLDSNSIFDKQIENYNTLWHTPVNDSVFYNGLLYDLSKIAINQQSSYNKYLENINNRDSYISISYNNNINEYLTEPNYDTWLKTQRITKFGSFFLPIPAMALYDNNYFTAQYTFSYTELDGEIMLHADFYNRNQTYTSIYDLNASNKIYNINTNLGFLSTKSNLKDYLDNNYDSAYYINYDDLKTNILSYIEENDGKYLSNEYILISDILNKNIVNDMKNINDEVKNSNNNLTNYIYLQLSNVIGIYPQSVGASIITSNNSAKTLKYFIDKLNEYPDKKADFLQDLNKDSDKNIEDLNVFDKLAFQTIYDLLLEYYLNTNPLIAPLILLNNTDLYNSFIETFSNQINSLVKDAYVFIDEYNLSELVDEKNNEIKYNEKLNKLYIKGNNSDTFNEVTYKTTKSGGKNTFDTITSNQLNLFFKSDLCLYDEYKQNVLQIKSNIQLELVQSIKTTLGDNFVCNQELQKLIRKIYDWLVKDTCKNIYWLYDLSDKDIIGFNQDVYNRQIDTYLSTDVYKLDSDIIVELRKLYNSQLFKFVENSSNYSDSFTWIQDYITNNINTKIYEYKPVLLTNSGSQLVSNVFVRKITDFYDEPNILWVNTFNLASIKKISFKDILDDGNSIKTFYSTFLSKGHIKKYMEVLSAANDGLLYVYRGQKKKLLEYNEWIKIDANQTFVGDDNLEYYGGPFTNLYISNKYLIYDDQKQQYFTKFRHVPLLDYLTSLIIENSKNTKNIDWIKKNIYNGLTLFKFINYISDTKDGLTLSINESFGPTGDDLSLNINEKKLCITFESQYIPVDDQIMSDSWGIFKDGKLVDKQELDTDKYIDFYIHYLYNDAEFDTNENYNRNKLISLEDFNKLENELTAKTSHSILRPLYNDYYYENMLNTKMYSEALMNNIKAFNYDNTRYYKRDSEYNFKGAIQLNKYIVNNIIIPIKEKYKNVFDIENKLANIPLYKQYTQPVLLNNITKKSQKYDVLGLLSDYNLYSYYKDGENYAFFLTPIIVQSQLIDTLYQFNQPDAIKNYTTTNKFWGINNIPMLEYSNNKLQTSIKGLNYLCSQIKNLLYFNTNIINEITASQPLIKFPETSHLTNGLKSRKLNNGVKNKIDEYTILQTNIKHTNTITRYKHFIEPNFQKVDSNIDYIYNLKFKNKDTKLLDKAIYNSIGDTPIYKIEKLNINEFNPLNIYGKGDENLDYYYNNIIEKFTPYEYTSFNDSNYYFLPEKLIFPLEKLYTYDELINIDKTDIRLNRFIQYCEDVRGIKSRPEILFLFNRYKTNLEFVANGLDEYTNKKVYTGNFIFTLK